MLCGAGAEVVCAAGPDALSSSVRISSSRDLKLSCRRSLSAVFSGFFDFFFFSFDLTGVESSTTGSLGIAAAGPT